jgi:two-component system response regulator
MDLYSMYMLLVEEDCEDAEMTIRELKRFCVANSLVHVKGGDEALDFLFSKSKDAGSGETCGMPKIILLDLQMPKANALEILKKMRGDDRTNGTPVIILTSSGQHPDLHDCYELGAASYIVKPMNFERFTQAIRSLDFSWRLLNRAPVRR